jgi:hypothetical protein
MDGEDLRQLPLSMRKASLAVLLRGRPDGIFVVPFEQGEIGPELFRAACRMGPWKTWSAGTVTGPIVVLYPPQGVRLSPLFTG